MFYRIRVDLTFTKEASINAIKNTVYDQLKNSVIINQDQINEEVGYVLLEKCYHDEDPTKACEILAAYTTPRL